ncbi:flavodoxin domain-containing protein [Actinoplanes derwentensis]|uniref:Menaquinone-dependent protoporphyrinogen oxidase n=1 Tax=Actinoplanes derwentensis TaxID=113562 RepID=A0A1H2B5Y4_9ACTN|nr:flavodoxin domain-containing protein [Actinoplanes derwentensis]GID87686.1 flavodoxin [Actinoplanes derwentensis]SDT53594.1 menaquinone-dependent protoporphyrinogen oxidase [Actinoplanes derwentensis]
MKILVSAASRHGSTAEIATGIAEAIRAGLTGDAVVEVLPAVAVSDPASYDAFVLGSAVYLGRWLEDARRLADRIVVQQPRPVWLFSSGPVGDPAKPDEEPAEIGELVTSTHALDHRLFAGRLVRHHLSFGEKAMVMALRVPDGDFRDWDAIAAWGTAIATALNPAGIPANRGRPDRR